MYKKKGGLVKENDSMFYYHKFGKYVDALDRWSLTLPKENRTLDRKTAYDQARTLDSAQRNSRVIHSASDGGQCKCVWLNLVVLYYVKTPATLFRYFVIFITFSSLR